MATRGVGVQDIVSALQSFGGQADVSSIKNEVQRRYGGLPSSHPSDYAFRNAIQKLVEDHCPQSATYRQNRPALFERAGQGVYRLSTPQSLLVADLEQFAADDRLDGSTRQRLVDARLGQGRFREVLVAYWQGCAVTAVTLPQVLRATHIKPWRACTELERLDPFNGLLLSANLDALFGSGLLSFADSGSALIARSLGDAERGSLGLGADMRLSRLSEQHRFYLAYHRENVLRSDAPDARTRPALL